VRKQSRDAWLHGNSRGSLSHSVPYEGASFFMVLLYQNHSGLHGQGRIHNISTHCKKYTTEGADDLDIALSHTLLSTKLVDIDAETGTYIKGLHYGLLNDHCSLDMMFYDL
jgi:hypothetical protein